MAIWHKRLHVTSKVDYRRPSERSLLVPWHLHPKSSAPISTSYDLTSFRAPIYNQGGIGSCTACGTIGSVQTSLAAAGRTISPPLAPLSLYRPTRMLARAKDWNGGPLPPLTDSGANPADAYQALTSYGCQTTVEECGEMGPSDTLTSYEEEHVNDLIVAEDLILDATFKVTGQFAIVSSGSQRLKDVAQAVSSKFAVGVSVYAADDRFQGYTGGIMAGPPVGSIPDHWVYITRYYQDAAGDFIFGLPNSWSEAWGINGEFLAFQDVILAADCLMVASVTPVFGGSVTI